MDNMAKTKCDSCGLFADGTDELDIGAFEYREELDHYIPTDEDMTNIVAGLDILSISLCSACRGDEMADLDRTLWCGYCCRNFKPRPLGLRVGKMYVCNECAIDYNIVSGVEQYPR